MDENQVRLTNCFQAVFPDLSIDQIHFASSGTVVDWDSVATVTLLAVVEEEFGITIETEDPARFDSFEGLLSHLHEVGTGSLR